jgi:hypothetical protein
MRGQSGEEGPSAFPLEPRSEVDGRAEAERSESSRRQRMPWNRPAAEKKRLEQFATLDERRHELPIGLGVGAKAGRSVFDGALEHDRRAVVERMRQRSRRLDEIEAVIGERQLPKERR